MDKPRKETEEGKRTPWGPKVYLFFAIIPFLWPLLIGVMLEDAYYKILNWRKRNRS